MSHVFSLALASFETKSVLPLLASQLFKKPALSCAVPPVSPHKRHGRVGSEAWISFRSFPSDGEGQEEIQGQFHIHVFAANEFFEFFSRCM